VEPVVKQEDEKPLEERSPDCKAQGALSQDPTRSPALQRTAVQKDAHTLKDPWWLARYKDLQYWFLRQLTQTVLPAFLLAVKRTWRLEQVALDPDTQRLLEEGHPVLFALWHGRMFAALVGLEVLSLQTLKPSLASGTPNQEAAQFPAILISRSRDGDFISLTAERLGYRHLIRGGYGRGGVKASRGVLAMLGEQKRSVLFFADGPKGPRYQVKSGLVKLATLAKVPVVPVTAACSQVIWRFPASWDDYQAPNFFSRMSLKLGAPLWPGSYESEETYRQACEQALRQLTESADKRYG
jgi:lysophospholipid acyltransferase (LPLAT)-like uncharacterized protein